MSAILVAYDGTESAKRALERAAALVDSAGRLAVVSVVPLAAAGGRSGGPLVPGDSIPEHRALLDEASAWLAAHDATAETIEATGDPANAICQVAEGGGFDLVVVGSRNRSGVKRTLLGSVSTHVVHNAHCDVLVVK